MIQQKEVEPGGALRSRPSGQKPSQHQCLIYVDLPPVLRCVDPIASFMKTAHCSQPRPITLLPDFLETYTWSTRMHGAP